MEADILFQRLMEMERKLLALARDLTNLRNDLAADDLREDSGRR